MIPFRLKLWLLKSRSIIFTHSCFILWGFMKHPSSKIYHSRYRIGIELNSEQDWEWDYKEERSKNGRTSRSISIYLITMEIRFYWIREIKEQKP